MEKTLYEEFIEEMESRGLRRAHSSLDDKDVTISEDDDAIYISTKGSKINDKIDTISIKGMRESRIRGRLFTHPYYIHLKVYDYNYEDAKPEDTVQFSITEFGKRFLKEDRHIIYYHYPYRTAGKLSLKRGVVLTKDKRLEIRIMRNGIPLKIGKFEINIECDKWYGMESK